MYCICSALAIGQFHFLALSLFTSLTSPLGWIRSTSYFNLHFPLSLPYLPLCISVCLSTSLYHLSLSLSLTLCCLAKLLCGALVWTSWILSFNKRLYCGFMHLLQRLCDIFSVLDLMRQVRHPFLARRISFIPSLVQRVFPVFVILSIRC